MEMKENEAYGPVSSSQPQPPLASEELMTCENKFSI